MKRLIVDMDGVLSDIYAQYVIMEYKETGTRIDIDGTWGKSEIEAFPNCRKHLNMEGFFRESPVMPGAKDGLKKLVEQFEVFVVSSAMEFPNSLREKYDWMAEHFPFISWKQLVLCGSKKLIEGDVMIDDHFKNLDHFQGRTILFTQPHNYLPANEPVSHERVRGWDEVIPLLVHQ